MFNKTNYFIEDKLFYYAFLGKYNFLFNAVNKMFSLTRTDATSFYIFKKYNFFDILNYNKHYDFMDRVIFARLNSVVSPLISPELTGLIKNQYHPFSLVLFSSSILSISSSYSKAALRLLPTRLVGRMAEPLLSLDRIKSLI
jgi:hypothetical protein